MAQKFCTYCGADLNGNTKFCVKCGKPLYKGTNSIKERKPFDVGIIFLVLVIILAFVCFGFSITSLVFAVLDLVNTTSTSTINGSFVFLLYVAGVALSLAAFVLSFFRKLKPLIILSVVSLAFVCEMNCMLFCITTFNYFAIFFTIPTVALLFLFEIVTIIKAVKSLKKALKIFPFILAVASLTLCFECGFPKDIVIQDSRIVYYKNPEIDLVIESEFNGAVVEGINSRVFADSDIETLTIEEGIISIGDCAFKDCAFLCKVVLPKSIRYIGLEAFYNCSKIASIKYNGTKSDFSRIDTWNPVFGRMVIVQCSDGPISYNV